ncbi:hypothetical protein [Streptomyces sp. NBC_00841]|uniref:hypothetical protein n=1 Tax=Streptomyces sp. NBC_00841 TaxID=2975847 RepID=UPI003FA39EE2
MDGPLGDVSPPGRLAEPGEGISPEELALAARNHGLPLEALRYDITPPGLHYVLVHYDIPRSGTAPRSSPCTAGSGRRWHWTWTRCGRSRPSHCASRWSARAMAGPGSYRGR